MKILAVILTTSISLAAQSPLKWEHDLAAAQKRAKKEGKPVFVDIWAEWCPPCQHLKNVVFPSLEAQQGLAGYVPVSLMTETRDRRMLPDNAKVAQRFKVDGYPTMLVLDSQGRELKRQVGAFRTGADLKGWLQQK